MNTIAFKFLLLLSLASIFLTSCGGDGDCVIENLSVQVGECNCADNYSIIVDFDISNASSEFVELFARNNQSIGFYKISDFPLTIDKFEMSGNSDDYLKVCVNDEPNCCAEIEFFPPDCSDECGLSNLIIETGECNEEGEYELIINFDFQNAGNEFFDLFIRNDELIGTYELANLPLVIENFQPSGEDYDFIKICINDNPDCCIVAEFMPPECSEGPCDIFDLAVEAGECNEDGSYELHINFEYENPGNEYFDLLVRNDELIGFYNLDELPLVIENFMPSGNDYDFIEVCINDNPDCCEVIEFLSPDCESECDIFDLSIEIGECLNEQEYELWVGFESSGTGNANIFQVFVRNDVLIGTYELSQNPVLIQEFPISGNDYDFIEVCIGENSDCCAVLEFMSPNCSEGECEIFDVDVLVGECTSDSTYNLVIDFEVNNPGNEFYEVFIRNNVNLGYYELVGERPLEFPNFEMSGNDYDFIKICINDMPDCCYEVEFMPPDC